MPVGPFQGVCLSFFHHDLEKTQQVVDVSRFQDDCEGSVLIVIGVMSGSAITSCGQVKRTPPTVRPGHPTSHVTVPPQSWML